MDSVTLKQTSSSKYIFALFVFAALSVTIIAVSQYEEDYSSHNGRELLTSVLLPATKTRATFTAGTISARFCAANDGGNCDWIPYAQAIGRMTIPAFILAPLSIIAFFAVCFGRCCCNGFGGWERTPGNVCYGKECCKSECYPHEFNGYGSGSIWTVKILYVLCFIALIAVMVPGFFGNSKLSHGIVRPGTAFLNFATNVTTRAQNALDQLSALPYTKGANSTLDSILTQIEPLQNTGQTVNTQIGKADQYRQPVFIVLLVLAPLFYGIGILGGVLNKWKLIFTCGMMAFLISTLIWLLFGVQYALLIVINDTCGEIVIWNNNLASASVVIAAGGTPQPPAQTSFFENINSIVSCSANSSFTPIKNQVDSGLDQTYRYACQDDALPSGCFNDQKVYFATEGRCLTTNTQSELDTVRNQQVCVLLRQYSVDNNVYFNSCKAAVDLARQGQFLTLDSNTTSSSTTYCKSILVSTCATSCINSDAKNVSIYVTQQLYYANQYFNILTYQVLPLLNCLVFQPLAGDFQDSVCNDLSNGGDLLEQAFLSIAIVLIPGTILAMLAAKRWRSDSYASSAHTGMNDYEMNPATPRQYEVARFDNITTLVGSSPKMDSDANPAYSPSPAYPDSNRGSVAPVYKPDTMNNPTFSPEHQGGSSRDSMDPETPQEESMMHEKRKSHYDPAGSPESERLDRF